MFTQVVEVNFTVSIHFNAETGHTTRVQVAGELGVFDWVVLLQALINGLVMIKVRVLEQQHAHAFSS